MGLFSEVYKVLTQRREAGVAAPARRVLSAPIQYDYDALFCPASTAMAVATVHRCVQLLSESVAQLPLRALVRRGGIYVPDPDPTLDFLLNVQPNPWQNAFDFKAQTIVEVLNGNAYILPVYDPNSYKLLRLVLCSRNSVTHDTENDTYTVSDSIQGVSGVFSEDEIIHIKGLQGPNPKTGVSVLTHARTAIETASAGDQETKKRFVSGGLLRALVGNDRSVHGFGEYQDEELEKAAQDLDARINRNGQNVVSVPGMVSVNQLSMTSADMQFLEQRKFTVREICRFFGVHPSFVFDDTSNNYKSAEMANAAFLSNTLNPLLCKIETELLRKLTDGESYGMRRFEFDRRELTACDLDSRVKYQAQTIAAGIYTVNEWRLAENKPPVEGGDTALVSANLRTIEELTQPKAEDNGNKQTT